MLRLLAAITGALVLTASPALAADSSCKRANGPAPEQGPTLATPVELTIEPATDVVNFAGGRGTKLREFVVSPKNNASLPDSLTPQQIELRTVRSFSRVGDKIETTTIHRPVMFTEPEVNLGANEIRFAACFDLEDTKGAPAVPVGEVRG